MKRSVVLSLAFASLCSAISFPARKVRYTGNRFSSARTGPSVLAANNAVLTNDQEQGYQIDVQIGGTTYTLAIDTGSSDLWFAPRPNYNQTLGNFKLFQDLYVNLTYGAGSAAGYVAQADNIGFTGLTVNNQTFLYVTKQDDVFNQIEAEDPGFQGIAGVGFDTISQINAAIINSTNQTWGRTLMSNIFLADPNTPNHLAVFLDRLGYLNDTGTGTFDIGTYAPGYEAVANQPKNAVFSGLPDVVFQWNVLVTGLSVNGKPQELETHVIANSSTGFTVKPPNGRISALLDTGSTLAGLPSATWKALYESMGGVLIKNTTLTEGSVLYAVPCMAEAQLEFTIGSQTILIHPLDLTNVSTLTFPDGRNLTACLSYFDEANYYGADNDLVLGDAFLRNVYAVYNYGNFNNTESGLSHDTPFIQLLPLTNASVASAEFKDARAKALKFFPPEVNVSTINDPVPQALSGSSAGSGSSNDGTSLKGSWYTFVPFISTIISILLGALYP
ncbi:hypothetical protein FRC09_014991 [Ceratobasidium sp. 395]|nr:hypothetical protein FRC09_014991 [Ceratobasidium sp. 395]